MSFIESIAERPTSHKTGFWVGSLLLLIFLFWQYLYKAKSEEFVELKERIEELNNSILQETRIARNLGKFKREIEELDRKLHLALQELPDKREIPDLLASISNLARDAGLEVGLFKPVAESVRDFYAEVPVALSVEGTFHQVATFFEEVGNLSRIVNISQITLRDPRPNESRIRVKSDCLVTTFRYLDDKERAAREAAERNKRR